MKISRCVILFLAFALLTNACELSHNIDIELPLGESFPLIEAYLIEGEQLQMLVFKSNTLQERVRINTIWNASVYIICDGDSLKLKNLLKLDRSNAYLFNYLLDTLVDSQVEEYSLYVETEGYPPITGVCSPVGPVVIEEISISDSMMLKVQSHNLHDAFSNYYQLRVLEYFDGDLTARYQMEFDFHDEMEGAVELNYPLPIIEYDSLRVDLYRLDSSAYVYNRSISNALSASRDPYSTPVPFVGNVANGWGIFTYVTRDRRTLYFQ